MNNSVIYVGMLPIYLLVFVCSHSYDQRNYCYYADADVGNIAGFTFKQDGQFYKNIGPLTTNRSMQTTRLKCLEQNAGVIVPYPDLSHQAWVDMRNSKPIYITYVYYFGMTSIANMTYVMDNGIIQRQKYLI
jgi:hypothetical protein